VIGVALIAGAAVWFLTADNRDGSSPLLGSASGDPRLIEDGEVQTVQDEVGHAVYWAGERLGTEIELSHDSLGNAHVRYLTGGAEPGAPEQNYLDVGTYPFDGAHDATVKLARQKDLAMVKAGGGIGFYERERPTNVYLVYPDEPDLQIEVFHPQGDGALEIVRSGDIVPMP
jgi:hypothetical protein